MTTPIAAPMSSLNLDDARAERAKARAARQEGRAETLPVILGGVTIAVLPAEFPLSVLEPLTEINVDLGFVIKTVMQAAKSGEKAKQEAGLDLIVNVLVVNPDLPATLLAAVQNMGRRLLGDEGYAALMAGKPSAGDIGALATGLLSWFGLSLGEFLGSSTSPSANGGETSKPTSSSTTADLTPAEPGDGPAIPDSSVAVVS
jgi:hypothetical protein